MAARQCHHCKQWIEAGSAHDCWTTTPAALTKDLSDDLRDAWERLHESALELGEQRVYASHRSIMFSRKACYFFVRPKRKALEVCIFLGRTLKAPQIRRVEAASRTKLVHVVDVTHRDQVEAPITDWLREAYETSDPLSARPATPAPKMKPARQPARAAAARPRRSTPPGNSSRPARSGTKPARGRRR